MKELIINGSPRKGNTLTAVNILASGGGEIIDAGSLDIKPCVACDGCKKNGGVCVFKDDSVEVTEKILEADKIIFATPVYWWSTTAQLKLVIDKLYQKSEILKDAPSKKIGLVVIGEAGLDDPEYRIIKEQMGCICGHLGWELAFAENISAGNVGDLAADKKECAKLEKIRKEF
ncbi:MAG: flavodoxin family protein [Eubacteriaceae bacterium]|nr:flavodoxin family protein [Eubacteriaceae bacterium]